MSFNHLIGLRNDEHGYFDAQRPRGLLVDDHLKFGRLLHGEIAGLGARQNARDESGGALVRTILELSDTPDAAARVQMAPLGATFDQLFAAGFGAVVKIGTLYRQAVIDLFEGPAERIDAFLAARVPQARRAAMAASAGVTAAALSVNRAGDTSKITQMPIRVRSRLSATQAGRETGHGYHFTRSAADDDSRDGLRQGPCRRTGP